MKIEQRVEFAGWPDGGVISVALRCCSIYIEYNLRSVLARALSCSLLTPRAKSAGKAAGHPARMLPGALGLKRRILRIGESNKPAKAIINTSD